jgi:hypothetical protein
VFIKVKYLNSKEVVGMNKPIIVALAVFFAAGVSVMGIQQAYAQGYAGSGTDIVTEETLAKCDQYGIPRANCTELNVIAKERLITARQTAYGNDPMGSGTSMIAQEASTTWVFIGILAAIFGGVAAAFFFRGRGAAPPS